MRKMIDLVRVCLCLSALAWGAAPAQAADPDGVAIKHGLMWHRSGLPAVFPLQVKTLGPQDYYVTLTNVDSDETVLAAYIEGGRFFRVLVPPGTFEVRFAYGNVWQGEEALFGPEGKTAFFDMPDPLTFGVRNFNTKGGHLVDLRDISPGQEARVVPEALFVCQGMRLVSTPTPEAYWVWRDWVKAEASWHARFGLPHGDRFREERRVLTHRRSDVLRYDVRTRQC